MVSTCDESSTTTPDDGKYNTQYNDNNATDATDDHDVLNRHVIRHCNNDNDNRILLQHLNDDNSRLTFHHQLELNLASC